MPKIVDHEARKDVIAKAVWNVVQRLGLDRATIREIAEESGYSTGMLAHYFAGKEELLLHALNYASRSTGERMRERAASLKGKEALRAVLLEMLPLDQQRRHEWQIWISFWGRAVADDSLMHEQKLRYKDIRSYLETLLEACKIAGDMTEHVDVATTATSILALVDGLGVQAYFEPRRLTAKRQRVIVEEELTRLLS